MSLLIWIIVTTAIVFGIPAIVAYFVDRKEQQQSKRITYKEWREANKCPYCMQVRCKCGYRPERFR
jgi:hypothetical protein